MMKVKFYLDSNKAVKAKQRAIWCYVREYDQTLALNTGERINPDLWDRETQRASLRKTKDKILKGSLKSINQYLNGFENKVYDIARTIRNKEFNAGFSVISDELKKQFNKRDTSFFAVYDEFLISKRLNITRSSMQKYDRLRALLQEYEKLTREKLRFDKITPLFFEKFYSYLINEKQLLNNTAHKNIQFFKSFMIWANTNNFTDNTSYRTFKTKSEQNEVIYLTENELMHLYNMIIDNERLERVRDLFVFQCFTGVRFSDIENLSWDDIKNSTWNLRTQKTKDIIQIPLSGYALSILAKYGDWEKPLPVISNQKMNKYLKELCKKAEINDKVKIVQYRGSERIENTYKKYEVIGSHTARRTFISLSLQKGMKPDVIMAITGHKTYRMMQKYLKIADETKRDEMDKVWGSSLRQIK
ncbi:MAG: tyrosine-type recombinase/integrase [Bacteroidetes bacterium]|nr:tyrosine-type recombinase/integrase [Bacteroidota bacterium]